MRPGEAEHAGALEASPGGSRMTARSRSRRAHDGPAPAARAEASTRTAPEPEPSTTASGQEAHDSPAHGLGGQEPNDGQEREHDSLGRGGPSTSCPCASHSGSGG